MGIDNIKDLKGLLDTCDIPENRKDDLEWLSRNLLTNNQHPAAIEAHKRVATMLRIGGGPDAIRYITMHPKTGRQVRESNG